MQPPSPQPSPQPDLTPEELATLAAVAWGVDVLDHGLAVRLRALEAAHPDLVLCTEPKGKYGVRERQPVLGACATGEGCELLIRRGFLSSDLRHWTTNDLLDARLTRLGSLGGGQ